MPIPNTVSVTLAPITSTPSATAGREARALPVSNRQATGGGPPSLRLVHHSPAPATAATSTTAAATAAIRPAPAAAPLRAGVAVAGVEAPGWKAAGA